MVSAPATELPPIERIIFPRQKERIERYLRAKESGTEPLTGLYADLWFAVGYFWHGTGVPYRDRLGLSQETWNHLLEVTGRT